MDALDRHILTKNALDMGYPSDKIEALLAKADAESKKARKRRGFWPRTWDTAELPPIEMR